MAKYHIITYGCQMNKSDSERLATQLETKKHQLAKSINQANLVIINVCSIRQSAINRVNSKIEQLNKFKIKNLKLKIILTGCILENDKKKFKDKVDQIWPIADLKTKTLCHPRKASPRGKSPKHTFVPIMTGCNNFCSYCAVPYTRGREKSRPASEIIKEVKNLIKNKHKEITLLGQNVNSYENNFPKLLKTLNDLSGSFEINFMTSHPKDMSNDLIKVIANGEKISKNIHLPIQSGDNVILKKMNRNYTVGHYKKLIKKIRQAIPEVKISTDIIVGFPGETEKQFQNTVKLVKEMNFEQAFVSCYSPRVGTTAHKFKDDILSGIKKERKKILSDMF